MSTTKICFFITNRRLIKALAALCSFTAIDIEDVMEILIDLTDEEGEYFEYALDAVGSLDDDKLTGLCNEVVIASEKERKQLQNRLGDVKTVTDVTVRNRRLIINVIHHPYKEPVRCS